MKASLFSCVVSWLCLLLAASCFSPALVLQANATADEAAQEASLEAAAKWEAKVEQLQVRLVEQQ